MNTRAKTSGQLLFFVSIGASAALVHIITVLSLVTYLELSPLLANVIAFLIAFNVSYLGHRYVTFARLDNQKKLSLPHFFLVASTGGIINEGLYYLILRYTHINYLMALIMVLAMVAVYSFILSRFWACRPVNLTLNTATD
ncbi:MAG: GtrA family protein [Legionella sp.]